jgi:peptidoglycan/xylan/chitin deacetylase (PgdA/CDA1 family)
MGYGFDDGPNCTHNIFYDYLASQNQKATMFYIGSSTLIWPLEAQRALADGHEICARECLACLLWHFATDRN